MLDLKYTPARSWELSANYSHIYFTDTAMATLIGYRTDEGCLEAFKIEDNSLVAKFGRIPRPESWYQDQESYHMCAGLTMGEDQHRLYALFFSRSQWEKDLYRMWVAQYETGAKDIEYTGIDLPIPAFTGVDFEDQSLITSPYNVHSLPTLIQNNQAGSLPLEGLTGWSWAIPDKDLMRYSSIISSHGYLFIMFPVWFRIYPAYYQAIIMIKESDASVEGTGIIGSSSMWPEDNYNPQTTAFNSTLKFWNYCPLATNIAELDGFFAFRFAMKRTFPLEWSADPFYTRWDQPRILDMIPGDPDEYRQPANCGTIPIKTLIDALKAPSRPTQIDLTPTYTNCPLVAPDYDCITSSHGGRRLYGLKDNLIQEYQVDYTRYAWFCEPSELYKLLSRLNTPEVFDSWDRFTHSYSGTSDYSNYWAFDPNTNSITATVNATDAYMGFVSPFKLDTYNLSVILSSNDLDDDMIGFVLAFVTDTATGKEYTLTALRGGGGMPSKTWALVYNFMQSDEKYLIDLTAADGGAHGSWRGTVGVRLDIQRIGDNFIIDTSPWNSNTINPSLQIAYDLDSDPLTHIFKGPTQLGFACHSQAGATWRFLLKTNPFNIEMTMPYGKYLPAEGIDRAIIVKNSSVYTTLHDYVLYIYDSAGLLHSSYPVGVILPDEEKVIHIFMSPLFSPDWKVEASYSLEVDG